METVFIKTRVSPDAVIENNNIHYFYWKIEIGFPELKIRGRKLLIPLPLKFNDYEPVKVFNIDGKSLVVSRFHYRILTFFNKLNVKNGKPVIDFFFGSHTPIALTKFDSKPHLGMDERWHELWETNDINAYEILVAIFKGILEHTIDVDLSFNNLESYDLVEREIPESVLLKPREMYAIIWFGSIPSTKEFREIGYDVE